MINKYKGGAAQPNLGAKDLKQFVLPLPPQSLQRQLTERLDGIKEQTHLLEAIYSEKSAALDELKKSLLHLAFTGQLTARAADRQLQAVA